MTAGAARICGSDGEVHVSCCDVLYLSRKIWPNRRRLPDPGGERLAKTSKSTRPPSGSFHSQSERFFTLFPRAFFLTPGTRGVAPGFAVLPVIAHPVYTHFPTSPRGTTPRKAVLVLFPPIEQIGHTRLNLS